MITSLGETCVRLYAECDVHRENAETLLYVPFNIEVWTEYVCIMDFHTYIVFSFYIQEVEEVQQNEEYAVRYLMERKERLQRSTENADF